VEALARLADGVFWRAAAGDREPVPAGHGNHPLVPGQILLATL